MLNPLKLFVSLLVVFTAATISALVTFPNIAVWYADLNTPYFSLPNWMFGPVWAALYVCMGFAFYFVWTAKAKKPKDAAYISFGTQLALDVVWAIVFFGLHRTTLSVAVILVLFMAVIITNRLFWPISRRAAWLLVPYSLWVCMVAALNVAVAVLH